MLGLCSPWHAFCTCNAKSVSFITKTRCCCCQGLLVASALPLSCCLCGLYLCGFVFSFPKLFCTSVWYVINQWDREILSWGKRDLAFSSCQGDALKWMLGERQSWLGSPRAGERHQGHCWRAALSCTQVGRQQLPCNLPTGAAAPLLPQQLRKAEKNKQAQSSQGLSSGEEKATLCLVCNTCCIPFPDSLLALSFHITS